MNISNKSYCIALEHMGICGCVVRDINNLCKRQQKNFISPKFPVALSGGQENQSKISNLVAIAKVVTNIQHDKVMRY